MKTLVNGKRPWLSQTERHSPAIFYSGMNKRLIRALLCTMLAVVSNVAQAQVTSDLFPLRQGDLATGDFFGRAVAMKDGNYAIVGTPNDDDLGLESGTARIYNRDAQNHWQASQKVRGSDGFAGDRFGFAVSIQDGVAAVGAPGDDDNGNGSGSVYVFTRNATTGVWVETAKITASDGAASDAFGGTVQIVGSALFIGATGDDDKGSGSGSVYYYQRDASTGNWGIVTKIVPADGAAGDRFGASLAVHGSLLAIGAPNDDDLGLDSGSTYIYVKNSANALWPFSVKLNANDGLAGDRFGSAVDLSFSRLIVGAPDTDAVGASSGAAYVFTRNAATGVWTQDPRIVGQDTKAGDSFGNSVAITAALLVVGAPLDDTDAGVNAGSAYLFDVGSSGTWPQRTKLVPRNQVAGDFFGITVAAWSDVALVGAPEADGVSFDTGVAYVFELNNRYVVGLGAHSPGGGGWVQERLYTSYRADRGFPRLPWPAYNAANGETRPALCDLDGDDRNDIVMGLGSGGGGYIYVVLDSGYTRWLQIPWPSYNSANGETFVACGDVDNDGYDEIIAGLGSGGQGYAYAFDDFYASYGSVSGGWMNMGWSAYSAANGEVHPSVGDLDGDPYEEVVLGTGAGGYRWFQVRDDADNGFVGTAWYQAGDTGSIPAADHAVWPAVCHNQRIVLGASSANTPGGGGWLNLRTKSGGIYQSGWARLDWSAYNVGTGSTRPVCGDLDLDGTKELLVGLGAGGGGYVAIFNASLLGTPRWERVDWAEYNTAVGSTWPAAR